MCTYNIDYNDYNANLCNGLQSLLASSEMSDVTLAVEGKYIMAHQVILSMFSSYFKDLFNARPANNTIFFMMNVKHRIMKCILAFIYEGKVELPSEDFQLFVETAKELKIKGLSDPNFQIVQSSLDLVNDTQGTSHNINEINVPLSRRLSKPVEQQAKKSKTDHVIPLMSEISVFPYNSVHNDKVEIKEMEKMEMMKSDTVDVGLTEILGLNDDTIEIDDDESTSNNVDAESVSTCDLLMEMGCEDQSNGEPVNVTFCKQKASKKITGCIWDNYRYSIKYERSGIKRWRCTYQSSHRNYCRGRIITTPDNYISLIHAHNHSADMARLKTFEFVSSRVLTQLSYDDLCRKYQIINKK